MQISKEVVKCLIRWIAVIYVATVIYHALESYYQYRVVQSRYLGVPRVEGY